MDELWEEIEAEKDLVESTLFELALALKSNEQSYVRLAGIAAFVHNLYNGMENIIKRMLLAKRIKSDFQSPFWHHELLKIAIEHEIVSQKLAARLRDYLGFRHFFVHAYSLRLDPAKLMPLARNAEDVWNSFYGEIVSSFQKLKQ